MSTHLKIPSLPKKYVAPILVSLAAGSGCWLFWLQDNSSARVAEPSAANFRAPGSPLNAGLSDGSEVKTKEAEKECIPCAKNGEEEKVTEEKQEVLGPAPKPFSQMALTQEEVETFLRKHQRDGASLIAAFAALGDLAYLQEAVNRAPELPEVAIVALAVGGFGDDSVWIQRLQAADPDNALVQFLVSLEAFRRQDGRVALDALQRVQVLPEFDEYRVPRMSLIEEAALDAGYSPEKASALASKSPDPTNALLPKYLELADLVSSHLSNYREKPEEVDWIFQAALKLGSELQKDREGRSLFMQAGAALYRQALYEGILASSPFPSLQDGPGVLAADEQKKKEYLILLSRTFSGVSWLERTAELPVLGFFQKKRELGERAAMLWALANQDR